MRIILESIVGSTLHGTSVNDGLEDLDLMAIGIEEREDFIGFSPVDCNVKRTKPQGVRSEAGDVDYVEYGLRKYLRLLLKGNPTVLLPLFAPKDCIKTMTDEGRDMVFLTDYIISKKVYVTYKGYMVQQKERLMGSRGQKNVTRPELVEKFGFDTKYAAHIVRLGMQGAELLKTCHITLPMPMNNREEIIKIRSGFYSFNQTIDLIKNAETMLDYAFDTSPLCDEPNYNKVEEWMIEKYLEHWNS